MNDNMEIGKQIIKLRQEQNLTQQELAENVGISVSYLRKIEEENCSPHAKTLSRIAYGLGVRIDELRRG